MGYTGGTTPDPTYQKIGDHTEALRVTFDPRIVSYEQILLKFWEEHDPMPFAFTGFQYRSALWHHTPTQEAVIKAVRKRLDGESPFSSSKSISFEATAPLSLSTLLNATSPPPGVPSGEKSREGTTLTGCQHLRYTSQS